MIPEQLPKRDRNPTQIAKVTVVIVTWNHSNYLPACLEALQEQTYPRFEIIVVDNASGDGSAEWISTHYPGMGLVCMESNIGFSHGFNTGVKMSDGEFVLSLNPDVTIQPDFIAALVSEVQKDAGVGIVAPKLLRADDPNKLDSTGLFLDRGRRPYDRGQMETDCGQYDDRREIFGACGAAALFRRAMIDDLKIGEEFFDEDFFAYYEDADLAWRSQLLGWRSVYAPAAVATHVRGWSDTLRKKPQNKNNLGPRLALRNRYLMIVKNDSLKYFLFDSPWIMLPDIPRLIYMALFRFAALAAIPDFLRLLPEARRKRREIRKRRLINPEALRPWLANQRGKL